MKPPRGGVKVQSGVPWSSLLLGTAQGAVGLVAEATVAVFTLYFVLAEGPRFRQKLLTSLSGDAEARAQAVTALAEVHHDVEQYMVNRVLINAGLGLVTWVVYALYGLEHAAVWGLTTALLHFVPYVGPAVGLSSRPPWRCSSTEPSRTCALWPASTWRWSPSRGTWSIPSSSGSSCGCPRPWSSSGRCSGS